MRWAAIAVLVQIATAQHIEVSPSTTGPAVGTLLIATRRSQDADLKQSVVLVVHSGRKGVIGLILNHPVDGETYFGGPIPIGMRTLVRSGVKPEKGEAIVDGVFLVGGKTSGKDSRVFAGYVGWTAQQVKDEIARGLWTVRVGDAAVVFDRNPKNLWRRLSGAGRH